MSAVQKIRDALYGGATDPVRMSQVKVLRLLDHQRWLLSDGRLGRRLVLSGRDYMNHEMSGLDLSWSIIEDASFALSRLRETRFTGAQMRNVDFTGCDLTRADFRGAQLDRVVFDEANQHLARFKPDDLLLPIPAP
jgi:uncharacterized protein YjbI with pentapeptide repeats